MTSDEILAVPVTRGLYRTWTDFKISRKGNSFLTQISKKTLCLDRTLKKKTVRTGTSAKNRAVPFTGGLNRNVNQL